MYLTKCKICAKVTKHNIVTDECLEPWYNRNQEEN